MISSLGGVLVSIQSIAQFLYTFPTHYISGHYCDILAGRLEVARRVWMSVSCFQKERLDLLCRTYDVCYPLNDLICVDRLTEEQLN
jgi:hypothetical protein